MTPQEMERIARENAIKELKEFQIDIGSCEDDLDNSPLYYALDMAIKALEQQPCEDCISREQTLKAFAEKCGGECGCCVYNGSGYDSAENCKLIKSMPSITPQSLEQIKWERDTAIKQLKELGYGLGERIEKCEDCISRTELLSRIDAERKHLLDLKMDGAEHIVVHHARRIIEDMPSVTPKTVTDFADKCQECGKIQNELLKNKWIPVSERLPEDYIHVLCQFTLGGMGECYLAHGVFHVVGGLVMTCNEVIAWMPLPQPYKAESEDRE